jgi:hypothetical protein
VCQSWLHVSALQDAIIRPFVREHSVKFKNMKCLCTMRSHVTLQCTCACHSLTHMYRGNVTTARHIHKLRRKTVDQDTPLPLDIDPSHGKHHLRYTPTTCTTIDLWSTSSVHHCYSILWAYGPGLFLTGHGVQRAMEYTTNIKITIPCQHSGEKKQCCVLFDCSEHNYYIVHIALQKGGYSSLNTNPTHSACYSIDLS